MDIQIRHASEKDLPYVYELIHELAEYENAPHEHVVSLKQFIKDGTGANPLYYSLIAECANEVLGIALYYIAYSTWKGKMLYLDDIVVKGEYRRCGIGRKLFDSLIKQAKNHKVNQLRWHVLDWNEPAIQFYKQLDASQEEDWITCKLEKDKLYL